LKFQEPSLASDVLISALLANCLIFAAAWAWCVKLRNFSPVDAFWAGCIGLTALFFLLVQSPNPKQITAAILIGLWSFRLCTHLSKRIFKHHPEEDSRYEKLREVWKGKENAMFFLFFQAKAISVFLLALPFWFIASDQNPHTTPLHIIGAIIAAVGLAGESLADKQMSAFKAEDPSPKSVCRKGLWKYSRHPNYFFESVIWIGFFLFAAGSPWGWTSIYAPAIITFLLLKVTGIPPTEASAVKRKGEAYREYQRTTSAFVPWPPKTQNSKPQLYAPHQPPRHRVEKHHNPSLFLES
jgi:steroid 5-alpha reductase family enzyme